MASGAHLAQAPPRRIRELAMGLYLGQEALQRRKLLALIGFRSFSRESGCFVAPIHPPARPPSTASETRLCDPGLQSPCRWGSLGGHEVTLSAPVRPCAWA